MHFILNNLKAAWAAPGVKDIIDLNLLPYGNAKRTPSGFACQHGEKECLHNKVLGCAIRSSNTTDSIVAFATCAENKIQADTSTQPSDVITSCGSNSKIQAAISDCFQGGKGTEAMTLYNKLGVETEALQKKYVPWIVVDGSHSKAGEENLLDTVCNVYMTQNGAAKVPAGCAKTTASRAQSMADMWQGVCMDGLDAEEDLAFRRYLGERRKSVVAANLRDVEGLYAEYQAGLLQNGSKPAHVQPQKHHHQKVLSPLASQALLRREE